MFRPLCIIEFEIAFIKKKFERARAPLELKLKLKLKLYRSARKFVIYIAIKKRFKYIVAKISNMEYAW